MSAGPGANGNGAGRDALGERLAGRQRADVVSGLRGLARGTQAQIRTLAKPGDAPRAPGEEVCEFCGTPIPVEHRHMLHLSERRILCACEVCIAERSAEAEYRPSGQRVVFLDDLAMADELWARLGIPIGLAFFTINGDTGETVAFYPSPAGSTECELDIDAWSELCDANPRLELEPDAEAFIVNRMSDPPQHVIVPIDECYAMIGAIRVAWEGISGGPEVDEAVASFFAQMRKRSGG
ncbi:DUF5947 family protein [soil metagenome]|jgi:hypothetical protein